MGTEQEEKITSRGKYQVYQYPKNLKLSKQLMKVFYYFPTFKSMKIKYFYESGSRSHTD